MADYTVLEKLLSYLKEGRTPSVSDAQRVGEVTRVGARPQGQELTRILEEGSTPRAEKAVRNVLRDTAGVSAHKILTALARAPRSVGRLGPIMIGIEALLYSADAEKGSDLTPEERGIKPTSGLTIPVNSFDSPMDLAQKPSTVEVLSSLTDSELPPALSPTKSALPTSAIEARLGDLNSKASARGMGTVWSLDSSGQLVATNTPETRGTLTSSSSAGSTETTSSANFAKAAADISNLPVGEQLPAMLNLQRSVEATLAGMKNSARIQAEKDYSVDDMKNALEASVKNDAIYRPADIPAEMDSDQTAQIRQQYIAAKNASESATAKYFAENPEAAAITGAVAPMLRITEQLFLKNQAKAEFAADKDAADKATLLSAVGPTAVKLANIVNPGVADPTLYASQVAQKDKKFVETALKMQEPKTLIPGALSGNVLDRQALITLQAEKTGGTEVSMDKARREVEMMESIVRDPREYNRQMEILYGKEKAAQMIALEDKGAEGEKLSAGERQGKRIARATEILRIQKSQKFLGDVGSWEDGGMFTDASSPLAPLYKAIRDRTGKSQVSLKQIATEMGGLPNEQRLQVRDLLLKAATSSADKASSGYFGDFSDVNEIDRIVSQGLLSATTSKTIWDIAKEVDTPLRGLFR